MIDSSVYLTFSDYLINPWSLGLFQIVVSSSFLSMKCIRERESLRDNLWYMLSNDDACSTWSWSIRMFINMILVTRFIDAVNDNFASTFYICGLSMFWTYYMTVMFIFLLYIKDLRECYCECQNQCSRHDQLSLEAKWTSKHHHHHHHAFRLHR